MDLDFYLEQLQKDSQMNIFLSSFDKVYEFKNLEDRLIGLLKFNKISNKHAYLFKFNKEEIINMHTIGMKFSISIKFYNSDGNLVKSEYNIKPNVKIISSIKPAKYAVEYLENNNDNN